MKRVLLCISGCASLAIGGAMSLLLFFSRVDPPEILMAQFMGVVAGGIVAGGVLVAGKASFPNPESRARSATRTLAVVMWLAIAGGLAIWHNAVIDTRMNARVHREQMEKESLEQHGGQISSEGAPSAPSRMGTQEWGQRNSIPGDRPRKPVESTGEQHLPKGEPAALRAPRVLETLWKNHL